MKYEASPTFKALLEAKPAQMKKNAARLRAPQQKECVGQTRLPAGLVGCHGDHPGFAPSPRPRPRYRLGKSRARTPSEDEHIFRVRPQVLDLRDEDTSCASTKHGVSWD